ncbi:MAG: hypothetical protein NUV67_06225 [archaeon]|nr:hypothetical protein [archaeon]
MIFIIGKNAFITAILLSLIVLAGCAQPIAQENTGDQNTGENENQGEQQPEEDNKPIINTPEDVETNDNVEISEKISSPYNCSDPLIVEAFTGLFGEGVSVARKPAPFGKTISYISCNVTLEGEPIVQLEFHEFTRLEEALDSMEDEARQSETQLFDATQKEITLGEKAFVISSENTGEHRIFFADIDGANPTFVTVRSLGGTGIDEQVVLSAANIIERLI